MKIAFYSDTVWGYGGVQRVLAEIAKALCKDHDVSILTSDCQIDMTMYDYDKSVINFDQIKYGNVPFLERLLCKGYSFFYKKILPVNRFTSRLYAKSFFLPTYRRILSDRINHEGYQKVIAVHAYCALHLAAVSHLIHAETIGWMHNSYEAFFEKQNPYLPSLKIFFKYQISLLSKVVVLTQIDRQRYWKELGLETNVIYNPLTIHVHGRGNRENKRFLSVGRFSKGHKGFDLLLKAFATFAGFYPEWRLDIVGEGPEYKFYSSLIVEYQLQKRVAIHPFTKDIATYYENASVYVLSSRWEGMPLVLMEAMAHGLPVISSDIPVAKELMNDKEVAVFFKSENISQLTDCLNYMASEADLEVMGEKAYLYSKEFDIKHISNQWNEIIS